MIFWGSALCVLSVLLFFKDLILLIRAQEKDGQQAVIKAGRWMGIEAVIFSLGVTLLCI